MRRLLAIALTVSFGHGSTAFAAGPLLASGMRAAQKAAAQSSAARPDLAKVKQRAAKLTGRHVAVKVASGTTLRGHIEDARADDFVLRLDDNAETVDVRYQDVQKIGPNMSTLAKTAIWLAVVAVGTAWAYETFSETRGTR